jgi:para-aminobenzoate synthetase component 1
MTTTARKGLRPHLTELPFSTMEPPEALARMARLPGCLLLESGGAGGSRSRWSMLSADPFLVLRARGSALEVRRGHAMERSAGDPFVALQKLLAEYHLPALVGGPPFQGGAAGYFGYELADLLERLPPAGTDDLALPDLCVGFYDWVLAWDHAGKRLLLVSTGLPAPRGSARGCHAALRSEQVLAWLAGAADPPEPSQDPDESGIVPGPALPPVQAGSTTAGVAPMVRTWPVPDLPGVVSSFSRDNYLAAVEKIRQYIVAGDIFQANLSQRLQCRVAEPPLSLHARLRRINPAPFSAYLDVGEAVVLSASPERLLKLRTGRLETRPIKGTARRGRTPARDVAAAASLLASPKDRAENIMIVDLLRNDLSTVCRDGSIRVPELCVLERHPTVYHLVSTVVGRLRRGLGAVDALRAVFPGGSISGAPKVRALEILRELEPTRRGVYTGAIGYIGFNGGMDTSIAIRTLVVKNGTAYFHVGGGVVLDSDPEQEYAETLDKARGLVAALAPGGMPAAAAAGAGADPHAAVRGGSPAGDRVARRASWSF